MACGSRMQSGPKGRDGATGKRDTTVAINGGRRRSQGLNQDNGGSSTGAKFEDSAAARRRDVCISFPPSKLSNQK